MKKKLVIYFYFTAEYDGTVYELCTNNTIHGGGTGDVEFNLCRCKSKSCDCVYIGCLNFWLGKQAALLSQSKPNRQRWLKPTVHTLYVQLSNNNKHMSLPNF